MKKSKLLVSLVFGFFVASNVVAAPKYISPNSGGKNDSLVIPFKVSDKRFIQGWSLVIMNSNHEVVRTIENKVALPTKVGFKGFFKQLVTAKKGIVVPEEIIWNGAMDNGEIAPDGLYYYYITATDDNGNIGKTKEYEVVIDGDAVGNMMTNLGGKLSMSVELAGGSEPVLITLEISRYF